MPSIFDDIPIREIAGLLDLADSLDLRPERKRGKKAIASATADMMESLGKRFQYTSDDEYLELLRAELQDAQDAKDTAWEAEVHDALKQFHRNRRQALRGPKSKKKK